jgi:uracil-DNA glycosylase
VTQLPLLLDSHRAALADCRRCGHPEGHALPVLSAARTPRVMLVGQAPGKNEAVDRRPFTGRAGRTLFRWLARAGISEAAVREHVYIAAVTRCYPGPHASGRGDRVPSPRERGLCASWLDAELVAIRPAVVIPVGRLAIERLVGAAALDRLVGRTIGVELTPGCHAAAIPLPHPSGASSWVHAPGHGVLLDRALARLADEFARLGLADLAPGEPATMAGRSVA